MIREQEKMDTLQQKFEEIKTKDTNLRKMYEKEIDKLNRKWGKREDKLNIKISQLNEEISIIKNINSKFKNLKILDQQTTLADLQQNIVDNSKLIINLKEQKINLEKEQRGLKTRINQLKLTNSIVSNEIKDIKSILKAVRNENKDLISLNKQIMKHKHDKTNPKLMQLAECSGVITHSEKLHFERLEFTKQVDWMTKRFKSFVYGIYQILMDRETSQIKNLQIQLKILVVKWGMFKELFKFSKK